MNPVISEVLSCISGPVVCRFDDQEKEYFSGAVAVAEMADVIKTSHAIENICVQDGKVCLIIIDRQAEIDEKTRNGWQNRKRKQVSSRASFEHLCGFVLSIWCILGRSEKEV